jgi:pSer/pThr/pTyr-binding forkhead associated (FHA) protein
MDSHELKIQNGHRAGESIPIPSGTLVIGTAPEVDLSFEDDQYISLRHCEVSLNGHECSIQDLSGWNGTYLNGKRISKREILKSGDQIGIGTIVLEFSPRVAETDSSDDSSSQLASTFGQDNGTTAVLTMTSEPTFIPKISPGNIVQCRLRRIFGTGSGKLCLINLGQSIEVGRSARCDYSFPEDLKMSEMHFRISMQRNCCLIEDLKTISGTLVNGVPVERCALVSGAEVQAGSTRFLVEITGVEWSGPPAGTPTVPAIGLAKLQRPVQETIKATCLAVHSDFISLRGSWSDEAAPVAWLERLLSQDGNFYLMLDLGQVEIELVEAEYEAFCSVFDWVPAPASKATPHLCDLRTFVSWRSAVEEAWGTDAMLVISSEKSRDELLVHLRAMLRGNENEDSEPKAIQGVCWPSILPPLLAVEAAGIARDYFGIVDAVWMERGGAQLEWEWIGRRSFLNRLSKSMGIEVRDMVGANIEV